MERLLIHPHLLFVAWASKPWYFMSLSRRSRSRFRGTLNPSRKNTLRNNRPTYRRPLKLERCEPRLLLAGDWQNPFVALDVSGNGVVFPADALLVINELNNRTISQANGALPPRSQHPSAPFYSTNGDDFIFPVDALLVINALNGDVQEPTITAQLVQDTAPRGATNNDGITRDARIAGRASDDLTGVTGLMAQIDNAPAVPVDMEPNGTFSLD